MNNEHYYTTNPTSSSDMQKITSRILGNDYTFWTDHGVFSRDHVDPGTIELLKAIDFNNASTILDLGCGYGVIGIVAACKMPSALLYMSDPNQRAVELSIKNAELNKVSNIIIANGAGFTAFPEQKYDMIITNPPIRTGNALVFELIRESALRLNIDGRFYLVARKKQGAETFKKVMAEKLSNIKQIGQGSGGYRVYEGTKKS
jgi:16S rRNA (guanine1207-N2)-methyltransferase